MNPSKERIPRKVVDRMMIWLSRKEKEREVWMISKFIRHLSPRIFLSAQSHFCCSDLLLSHIIILSTTFLGILSLLGFMCRSTSSLAHFCRCIRLQRHALYLMNVIPLSPVCRVSLVEIKGVCTFAK